MLGLFTAFVFALAAVGEAKVMPAWNPDFSIIEDKLRTLPVAKVTKINTWTNTVPTHCWDTALKEKCTNINDLEVFEAWFEDAPQPWLVCRCKANAKYTQDQFLTEIGRLPVAIRQRVRYFMLFNSGGGAYSVNNDVVFKDKISPTMLLHESAHAFDNGRNGQQVWKDAIEKDSCWADNYAKSTGESGQLADPWAQILVIHQYLTRIGDLPKPADCMINQVWTLAIQVYSELNKGWNPDLKRPYGPTRQRTTSAKFRI